MEQLSVVWIIVAPVPVDGLLLSVQPNESTPLVVLGLVPLVRAVFIAVPGVIVLVAPVVVTPVVLDFPIFLVPVLVPVFLRAASSHQGNRRCKDGSQKKRTEIPESTLHVVLLGARFASSEPR